MAAQRENQRQEKEYMSNGRSSAEGARKTKGVTLSGRRGSEEEEDVAKVDEEITERDILDGRRVEKGRR